jgi:hypothetical protein
LTPENFRDIDNEHVAWSRMGNPIEVDIHPHSYAMLDIARCLCFDREAQVHIPSEHGWRALRCALGKRRYRFHIRVRLSTARAL